MISLRGHQLGSA